MKKNDFHYVSVLLNMIYGLELEDEDMEELGLIGWEEIGNRDIRFYRFSSDLDCDNSVTLPCNVDEIELVTASYEDWERVTNKHELGNQNTAFVELFIEAEKQYPSHFYLPGKILKYTLIGDKLYFAHNYGRVNILYKGVLMDEDGLPKLTNKEALAIATYIAYIIKYKEGLVTNNANTILLANSLKLLWLQQCDQARITYLNQNDMNNILDVAHSYDRHTYGKSFKVIK